MEELNSEILLELLDAREFKKLKEKLENMHPVDIVEVMEEVGERQRVLMFRLLAKEEAAEVFTDMNSDMREDLINALTDSELEEVILNCFYSINQIFLIDSFCFLIISACLHSFPESCLSYSIWSTIVCQ